MSKLTPKAPGRPISRLDKTQSRDVLAAQHPNQRRAQARRVGAWPHEVKAVGGGICTRVRKLKGL